MLGNIHSVSKNILIPESIKPISSWLFLESKEKNIDELKKIELIIKGKDLLDEYDIKALSFIELKIFLLNQSNFVLKEKNPVTICHGDYHKANILFTSEGDIIGVCDWDICGKANPYIEFVRSFNMCVVSRDYSNYQNKKEKTQAFVDGYVSTCGFSFDISELKYAVESWYEKLLSTT